MASINLSERERVALRDLLLEEAQRMDDDGREGSFAASPLQAIWDKLRQMPRPGKRES